MLMHINLFHFLFTHIFQKFFILFFCTSSVLWSSFCYFTPPKNWDIVNPEKLPPSVKIAFVEKNEKNQALCSSLNLAEEAVEISLKEYVDIVRKIYTNNPNAKWRDIGDYPSPIGIGRLVEIEMKTPQGLTRVLQWMVIINKKVYILTMNFFKKSFLESSQEFEKIIQSIKLTDQLIDDVPPLKKEVLEQQLQKLYSLIKTKQSAYPSIDQLWVNSDFQEKIWVPFQEKIIQDLGEMGSYWQILFLQDIQEKILKKDCF